MKPVCLFLLLVSINVDEIFHTSTMKTVFVIFPKFGTIQKGTPLKGYRKQHEKLKTNKENTIEKKQIRSFEL